MIEIRRPGALEAPDFHRLYEESLAEVHLLKAKLCEQSVVLHSIETKSQEQADEKSKLMSTLLAANEHLVLATFGAQDDAASAEESNRSQTEFLSMLAHELRNPLQPILHATAMLSHGEGDDKQLGRLQEIIERQVGHMARMINDLLDAARIQNGKIGLERGDVMVGEVLNVALEMSQPLTDNRKQQVHLVQPATALNLYGDRTRLIQVFSNLINNASKFSPEGSTIEIVAQVTGEAVQISIVDHGAGMKPELVPLVFELFKQGEQSLDRSQGGLGIGLTMVRTLVAQHGGTVKAYSAGSDMGSTFTVVLPLAAPAAVEAPPPAISASQVEVSGKYRILIVEDNVDASDSLRMLLEMEGHIVTQNFDGADALEIVSNQATDLVICDIGLPVLDGYSVVMGIKQALGSAAPLCIATTGYSRPEDREKALASGFDHFLVKPVDIDALLQVIKMHVH